MGIISKIMNREEVKPQPAPVQNVPLKKIMIVTNDQNLKYEYMKFLNTGQYQLETVSNGADGLNNLLTFRPDALLIDVDLPVMDGRAMLHHMRALPEYKATPVVMVANNADVETIKQVKTYDNAHELFTKASTTPQQVIEYLVSIVSGQGQSGSA